MKVREINPSTKERGSREQWPGNVSGHQSRWWGGVEGDGFVKRKYEVMIGKNLVPLELVKDIKSRNFC